MKLLKQVKPVVFIEDFSMKVLNNEEVDLIEIPREVIVDGEILDFSHLFYIVKKYSENSRLSNIILIISSSSILEINLTLPKVKDEEIEEMARYEIEDMLPVSIDDYYLRYTSNILDESIEVKVGLLKKSIKDKYLELFNDLNIKVSELYSISDTSLDSDFINYSINNIFSNINGIKINDFDNLICKIMGENKISYLSLTNIIDDKFEDMSNEEKERIKSKAWINIYSKLTYLKSKLSSKKLYFMGELLTDRVKAHIEDDFKSEVEFLSLKDLKFDTKFSYIDGKKINGIKKYLFLSLFLIINLLIYVGLSYNVNNRADSISALNEEKNSLSANIKSQNFNELKTKNDDLKKQAELNKKVKDELNRNLKFEDIVIKLESLNGEDVICTDYSYDNGIIYVSGISRDESKLLETFNSLGIKYELAQKDINDGIISYRILIELEEI